MKIWSLKFKCSVKRHVYKSRKYLRLWKKYKESKYKEKKETMMGQSKISNTILMKTKMAENSQKKNDRNVKSLSFWASGTLPMTCMLVRYSSSSGK